MLTAQTATRLRERLAVVSVLRQGLDSLKPEWTEQPALQQGVAQLPLWWAPRHDEELAQVSAYKIPSVHFK